MANDLVIHRLVHGAEGGQVLDLDQRRFGGPTDLDDVDGGLTPHGTLLHVAVAHADPAEDELELLEVGAALVGAGEVGLGDDLHQRQATSVEVDAACRSRSAVDVLAGVLLEMHSPHPDPLRPGLRVDQHVAVLAKGLLILADLVVLGEVWVEVVLPGEDAARRDVAVKGQPSEDGHLDRALVRHREGARLSRADGADLGVGWRAELGGTAAEHLARGEELSVDLEADEWLGCHVRQFLSQYLDQPAVAAAIDEPHDAEVAEQHSSAA